jgi:hypothetical protein
MAMLELGTHVRIQGRRISADIGGGIEPPWAGTITHAWADRDGVAYMVLPDKGELSITVRAEHVRVDTR